MAKKRFVIDTNVLLHDPTSLLKFEDNILVISPVVLEELDKIKTKNRDVAADARQVIRMLDQIIGDEDPAVLCSEGVERNEQGGLLVIPSLLENGELLAELSKGSNDQKIIRDALILKKKEEQESGNHGLSKTNSSRQSAQQVGHGTEIIFVSKDINARLLAKATGLKAEDYKAAKIIGKEQDLQSGIVSLPEEDLWKCYISQNENQMYRFKREALEAALNTKIYPNMVIIPDPKDPGGGPVDPVKFLVIRSIDEDSVEASHHKLNETQDIGLQPLCIKQAAAIEALMNDDLPLVILTGKAGSGKTLLTLAAGLELTMNEKIMNKVICSRAAQDLDEGIGFLPGSEEEKVGPWLGAIRDNIEVLFDTGETGDKAKATMEFLFEQVERYIQYKSINFMRGRSFQNTYFLLDEAQNLTPHQIKTLVTRMGEGSKIVVMGDLSQIDNPLLSQYSSGLTYLIERMSDSQLCAHIELEGSPRSALAEDAGQRL